METILKEFDDRFGQPGPDRNCDSIGKGAGCDDCPSNVEIRDEHRNFLIKSYIKVYESLIEEFKNCYRTEGSDNIVIIAENESHNRCLNKQIDHLQSLIKLAESKLK